MKTTLLVIKDKYNNHKNWLVKRKGSGNYLFNQEIYGVKTNRGFIPVHKHFIEDVLQSELIYNPINNTLEVQ